MNLMLYLARTAEASKNRVRGQILVLAALAMLAIVGGVAIVVDGGNAYANQRATQNGTDAAAEAGATVLAQYLAMNQAGKTEADVSGIIETTAKKNGVEKVTGYYTNYQGKPIDVNGVVTTVDGAVKIGSGTLPVNVQGVRVFGDHQFKTFFAGAVGFGSMKAATAATAVTGRLTGGVFLPVVFPINIVDCSGNGSLGTGESAWTVSQPGNPPVGQEYIVPLCKTGGGNFMILDLDPNLDCGQEVTNPPAVQWQLPTWVHSDNGNNCAKQIVNAMNGTWHGKVVTVPVCEGSPSQACNQQGNGSNAYYHIVKVASFYIDYMSDQNGGKNTLCQGNGTTLIPIAGNGSSSCIAGWFVRYVTVGPIGEGVPGNSDAIGVQLLE